MCLASVTQITAILLERLMKLGLFDDEAEHARRQLAFAQFQWIDANDRAEIFVADVEVRRRVIVQLHGDHDAQESADLRHRSPSPQRKSIPSPLRHARGYLLQLSFNDTARLNTGLALV